MRHARTILVAPLALALSGCCYWDSDYDPPYHEVTVKNHTDQTVTIRYTAVTHVWQNDDDSWYYRYADRVSDIAAGKSMEIRVPRDSDVEIKADYDDLIHWFRKDADRWCSCDLTITMEEEDFVPAMPVAHG